LDHTISRFVAGISKDDSGRKHELWVLSKNIPEKFEVTHRSGILLKVFPVDFKSAFVPLETSLQMLHSVLSYSDSTENICWHLHSYYLFMFEFLVILLALKKQKIVAHHRGGGISWRSLPYSIWHYGIVLPILLRIPSFLLVQNKREIKRLKQFYRIKNEKIIWIPNAYKFPEFTEHDQEKPIALYVGRVIVYKGIEEMLKIIEEINRDIFVEFNILGDGDLRQKVYNKQWTWLNMPGHVSQERIFDYMKLSNLFLFGTTKKEGSPQSLIDAQGAGIAAVGFACEGVEDVIINGETGFLVKNWQEFKDKTFILVKDKELRTRMAISAKLNIQKNFSWPVLSKRTLSIYERTFSPQ